MNKHSQYNAMIYRIYCFFRDNSDNWYHRTKISEINSISSGASDKITSLLFNLGILEKKKANGGVIYFRYND